MVLRVSRRNQHRTCGAGLGPAPVLCGGMEVDIMVSYPAIIQALREAGESNPDLRDSVGLYVDLLELQSGVDAGPSRSQLSVTEVAGHMHTGQPLVAAGAWTVDSRSLAPLCVQVAHKTAQHRRGLTRPLASISAWFVAHRDSLGRAVFDYLNRGYCQDALDAGLDAGLHRFVLAHGLRPFLRVEADRLTPLIDMRTWFRGICPICGGEPDMAALDREDGGRRLLCSQCDSEWPFFRTVCPFCGDDSHIGYYAAKPGYRLYSCDACKRYIKTIDLRDVAGQRPLPVERILTVDMDVAAQAAGWVARQLR